MPSGACRPACGRRLQGDPTACHRTPGVRDRCSASEIELHLKPARTTLWQLAFTSNDTPPTMRTISFIAFLIPTLVQGRCVSRARARRERQTSPQFQTSIETFPSRPDPAAGLPSRRAAACSSRPTSRTARTTLCSLSATSRRRTMATPSASSRSTAPSPQAAASASSSARRSTHGVRTRRPTTPWPRLRQARAAAKRGPRRVRAPRRAPLRGTSEPVDARVPLLCNNPPRLTLAAARLPATQCATRPRLRGVRRGRVTARASVGQHWRDARRPASRGRCTSTGAAAAGARAVGEASLNL